MAKEKMGKIIGLENLKNGGSSEEKVIKKKKTSTNERSERTVFAQKKLKEKGVSIRGLSLEKMEEMLLEKNDSNESTDVVSEENQTLIKEVGENITFEEEQKKKELAFFNQWNDRVEKIEPQEKIAPKQKGTLKNKTLVYPHDYQSNTSQRNMAYVPSERLIQEIRNKNLEKSQKVNPENESKSIETRKVSEKEFNQALDTFQSQKYDALKTLGSRNGSQEEVDEVLKKHEKTVDLYKKTHEIEVGVEIEKTTKKEEKGDTFIAPTTDKEKEIVTTSQNIELTDTQKDIFLEKVSRSGFTYRQLEGTGIEDLSFEKKMLLLDTLEQQVLDKVKRDAKEAFEEDLKKSGKLGRIWKNVRKGYNIAKKEKEVLQKHKDGESLVSQETAKALAETVSSITAPITYKEGRTEISYMEEKDASGVENSFAKEFNTAANTFSKIPSEWQFSHNKKEQAQYAQSKLVFDTVCSEIIAQAPETSQGELMEKVQYATGNVTLLQHLMTHPEAGAVLARAGKTKAWQTGIESYYKENASFMALGMASRQAVTGASIATLSGSIGIASALAAPITGGLIGGLRARERAKKSLAEKDTLTRRGDSINGPEHLKKKMVDAEEITNVFEYLIKNIEITTDPEKKKRFLASLETRTKFIKKELDEGRVSFGELPENLLNKKKKNTGNTDADRIRRYTSVIQKISEAKVLIKAHTPDDEDIHYVRKITQGIIEQELKNKKITETRKDEIYHETVKGVLIGAGFGTAGWLVRHMLPDVDLGISEKVGELYKNAKGGVEKFFGEQKNEIEKLKFFSADRTIPKHTPLTDIEIKNISTEKDNVLRHQHVPIDESTQYEQPKTPDSKIIENLNQHSQDPSSVISKNTGENLSVIGKGVPTTEVTVSSKGFIKTIEELQKTFLKEHPTEKLPDSLNGNPTEIAQKLGLYNPEGSKSGMVIGNKETTLGINEQGDIVLHDATKNTETILSAKNTFKGSFIETGKVNIPAQESVQTDYTESSHGEEIDSKTIESTENTTTAGEKEIDAVRYFRANPLTYEVASHYAGDDSIGDIREKDPQLFKYLEDLRKKSGLEYNGDDDSATNYVQRAMKKIEGIESSSAEHIETNPSQESTIEEDMHSENVESDVSPEETTIKTSAQTPEQVLDEPLDTPKARGVMSPEQVSQAINARVDGDMNGTVDSIFGQKRNFLFDRNIIEGSGARNPAWKNIANIKMYDFLYNQNPAQVSSENRLLMDTFRKLHEETGNAVPRQGETITVEQYLKKEYETLAQQEYKKAGTLMKK
ncbi:hypothetical protein IT403_01710 [Candidatus Nomurabacteria bacterium]|nr:hypothetical protein [Candidatus Nomurabacteria bacterium]